MTDNYEQYDNSNCGNVSFALRLSARLSAGQIAFTNGIVLTEEEYDKSAEIIYQNLLKEQKYKEIKQIISTKYENEKNKKEEDEYEAEEEYNEEEEYDEAEDDAVERLLARERQKKYENEQNEQDYETDDS